MIYLVIATFILSAAIISGSIVVTSHLKSTYPSVGFSTLLYFLAFYFTFGFYALWGQQLTTILLSVNIENELLTRITDIMVVLGSPFMIFAAIMFIKFSRELSGRQTSDTVIIIFILGSLLIIISLAYALITYHQFPSKLILRNYYILLMILFTASGIIHLLIPEKKHLKIPGRDLFHLSVILLLILILQQIFLQLLSKSIIYFHLFIIFYFLFGGIIPVYIKYICDLSGLRLDVSKMSALEDFFQNFQISPREKEIIMELSKGFSNQEIADRLYISLQTVKDHTSRIYSKANCTGRAQLIAMINEIRTSTPNGD